MTRIQQIGRHDYEVLAEQEGSEFYEWSLAALVRRDGQLYLYRDGGCSCNGPYDYADAEGAEEQLIAVSTWHVAAAAVQESLPYHFDADDAAAFAEKCMAAMRP